MTGEAGRVGTEDMVLISWSYSSSDVVGVASQSSKWRGLEGSWSPLVSAKRMQNLQSLGTT